MNEEKNKNREGREQALPAKYPVHSYEEMIGEVSREAAGLERLRERSKQIEREIRKWLSLMG